MRLDFDRGTITLSGCSESQAASLPGVLWDPRAEVFRAPGHRYAALREALARRHAPAAEGDDGAPPAVLPIEGPDEKALIFRGGEVIEWKVAGEGTPEG